MRSKAVVPCANNSTDVDVRSRPCVRKQRLHLSARTKRPALRLPVARARYHHHLRPACTDHLPAAGNPDRRRRRRLAPERRRHPAAGNPDRRRRRRLALETHRHPAAGIPDRRRRLHRLAPERRRHPAAKILERRYLRTRHSPVVSTRIRHRPARPAVERHRNRSAAVILERHRGPEI